MIGKVYIYGNTSNNKERVKAFFSLRTGLSENISLCSFSLRAAFARGVCESLNIKNIILCIMNIRNQKVAALLSSI